MTYRTRPTHHDCGVCNDKGFVLPAGEVSPCPGCNPDSGYEPGEYRAELVKLKGRCGFAKGGGGRTCPLEKGHTDDHIFACGR
jgi:hypothetical protein